MVRGPSDFGTPTTSHRDCRGRAAQMQIEVCSGGRNIAQQFDGLPCMRQLPGAVEVGTSHLVPT
jgi:hypothetical protein